MLTTRTPRRLTILQLYRDGMSGAQIARALRITRQSVCWHLRAEGIQGKRYGYVKEITPWQEAVLIGTLLGDGRLCRGAKHHNAQLKLGHGPAQLDYMLWKKQQLAAFFTETVKPYKYITKEGYETYEIRSRSHPLLTPYLELFYPNGPKQISRHLLKLVTEHAFHAALMAVWYMDDGHLKDDAACFMIGGLDRLQYEMIFAWLAHAGWYGHASKQIGNCFCYRIASSASLRFAELIAPYMHKDLMYKLPSDRPRRKIVRCRVPLTHY
jgi:hypothetical protein